MIDTPTLSGVYTAGHPQKPEDAIPRDPELAEKAWKWIEEELQNSGLFFLIIIN